MSGTWFNFRASLTDFPEMCYYQLYNLVQHQWYYTLGTSRFERILITHLILLALTKSSIFLAFISLSFHSVCLGAGFLSPHLGKSVRFFKVSGCQWPIHRLRYAGEDGDSEGFFSIFFRHFFSLLLWLVQLLS